MTTDSKTLLRVALGWVRFVAIPSLLVVAYSCDGTTPTEAGGQQQASDDVAAADREPRGESAEPFVAPEAPPGGVTVEGVVSYTFDKERPWRFGRYYVDGRKTGPLAEAVVCLEAASARRRLLPGSPSIVVIDQKDHAFVPETVAVRVRDSVRVTNSDYTLHNVHSLSSLLPFNVNVSSGDEYVITCTKAGGIERPALVGCHLHSSMRGWIFVFDHPFFQVTARDGRFRFDSVPPGRYELVLVHPAGRLKWRQRVDVESGAHPSVEIAISPDHFEEF